MNTKLEILKQQAQKALGDAYIRRLAMLEQDALEWGKPNSKRYKAILMGGLELAIENASYETVFIPPSQETLDWGGFLGGEFVRVKRSNDN